MTVLAGGWEPTLAIILWWVLLAFSDLRGNGGGSGTDWQVSAGTDQPPPSSDKRYGSGPDGSDLIKVVLLGAPGVGKTAIAQVICSLLPQKLYMTLS